MTICAVRWRYFFKTINPDGKTNATVVHSVEDRKLQKDGYCMFMLNGRHWRRSMEILRVEDSAECTFYLLRTRYVFCADGKSISPAQEIRLSKMANISMAIVRYKATFTDTSHSLLSYARACEENYSVRNIDIRLSYIVEELMSSKFLADSSRATYIRYNTVAKMMIQHQHVLRIRESRAKMLQR